MAPVDILVQSNLLNFNDIYKYIIKKNEESENNVILVYGKIMFNRNWKTWENYVW